jgi:hypothetical protein
MASHHYFVVRIKSAEIEETFSVRASCAGAALSKVMMHISKTFYSDRDINFSESFVLDIRRVAPSQGRKEKAKIL